MTAPRPLYPRRRASVIDAATRHELFSPAHCVAHCSPAEALLCRPSCAFYAERVRALAAAPYTWEAWQERYEPERLRALPPVVRVFHRPTWRSRLANLWARVGYLVVVSAVGYVLWHTAAAVAEGRLRPW